MATEEKKSEETEETPPPIAVKVNEDTLHQFGQPPHESDVRHNSPSETIFASERQEPPAHNAADVIVRPSAGAPIIVDGSNPPVLVVGPEEARARPDMQFPDTGSVQHFPPGVTPPK